MDTGDYPKLAQAWIDIWNGDLSLIDTTVHEDFAYHAAPLTGGPVVRTEGRAPLAAWISGTHENVKHLAFTVQIGPLVDEPHVVLRWYATGSTPDGRPVGFHGTDILRVADGMIAEYWINADGVLFLQQLGKRDLPPLS